MADENAVPPAGDADSGGDPAENAQGGAAVDQPTSESEIRDPAAYYKAQAEKLERLLKKEADTRQTLEQRLETVGKSTEDSVKAEFEALKAELEAERTAAQQARLDAVRAKAVADAGLPGNLAKFVRGEDAEAIAAEVEELKSLYSPPKPKAAESARTANPGDGAGSDLTMERIKQMSAEEYIARRDDVRAFLKRQQSK